MKTTKNNILVVCDSIGIHQAIIDSLDDRHETYETSNAAEAWAMLETMDTISLVFLDMKIPTMDSLILMRNIRGAESERIANLPVIIITENEDRDAARHASSIIGATSYITKPFSSTAILKLVNSYSRLNKNALNSNHADKYDKLTGCLNEESFSEYCSSILEYAKNSHEDTSLLCMQIMGLDDAFGNLDENISEQIIVSIADYLKQACRRDEKVAYLGAGKFSIMLLTTNDFRANIVSIRLQKKISTLKFRQEETRILLKVAIGISATNSNNNQYNFDMFYLQAEQALAISMDEPDVAIIRYDGKFERDLDAKRG